MARGLRIERVGGWYHVTARGNERRDIFRDDRDRRHFLELPEERVGRFRIGLHAFVLMDNRYHLLAGARRGVAKWKEFRDRHGDSGRGLAMYVVRAVGGLSLTQMAGLAGMASAAAAAMSLRRYSARLRMNAAERATLDRVTKLLIVRS